MQYRLFQNLKMNPFLKWAGGKSQLLEILLNYFPKEIFNGEIKRYAEPFIGGGAVFFHIISNFPEIEEYYISDRNPDLILAYKTIRDFIEELIINLEQLECFYLKLNIENRNNFFYQIRESYNRERQGFDYQKSGSHWVERSTKLIFLNRTCFNGLYRVNSKGDFNVPVGLYKNPRICDSNNLKNISTALLNVKILHADYSECESFVDSNTFVYFDPPYRPLNSTSSFTAYSMDSFNDFEQERLAKFYSQLNRTGAKLMLSNSDPQNTNKDDLFFETIYKGFIISKIDAIRMINSKVDKRGKIKELIITNYEREKSR